MTPTKAQLDRAAALIKATAAHEQAIPLLGRMIDAAQVVADASTRARNEATNFAARPDLLATLPKLMRHDPAMRQAALFQYTTLLINMISPLLGGPPLRIDFDALKPEARPYLLTPYLKLAVNGLYPHLDVIRSDLPHRLTYVVTSGAVDVALWRAQLEHVNAYLGGSYQVTAHTSTTITLERRATLPNSISFNPAWLRPGHLFLGINHDTQRPFYAAFADLSHLLITGTVGMGKSVGLASIARSLLAGMAHIAHVYAVDPGGIAFSRYRRLHPKFTTHTKPHELWAITAELVALMDARENQLGPSGREKFTDQFLFLVVDEFPAYGTPETTDKKSDDYKKHQQFMAHLMALVRRGRKSGIRVILTTQEPTDRDIDTGLRSAIPGALAFRLPVPAHSASLFGGTKPPTLPVDMTTLPRGQALYRDGTTGELAHVQFPLIPPPGGKS